MRRSTVAALASLLALPVPGLVTGVEQGPTGTWLDGLEVGTCFDDAFDANGDFDYSKAAAIVPCDGPHGNEVVARVPLGDGDFPTEDLVPVVDELCLSEYERFLGRPIESTLMFPFSVAPDAADWAAGAHDALCMVYTSEYVPGTAASGSLRAPGETVAAYREVDQKPDIWLIDAGTGDALRNLTDNDLVKLVITRPTMSSPAGRATDRC